MSEEWPEGSTASKLQTVLRNNGELIAAQATVAQQAQMIEHLRGQLAAAGYTAVDMTTAAAQGFRDGQEALREELASANSRANAWKEQERLRGIQASNAAQECDDLQQRLADAERRNAVLLELLKAPAYLEPGAYLPEIDVYEWFRWNSEYRPINKRHLCDVVLRDGRILFDQSPYDFDWSYDGEVLGARHRGERGES